MSDHTLTFFFFLVFSGTGIASCSELSELLDLEMKNYTFGNPNNNPLLPTME